MKFLPKISGILFFLYAIIMLACGCKKQADNIKSYFASKEDKLINGNWNLENAAKNGTDISISACSYLAPYSLPNFKGQDVYFEKHGETTIGCQILNQGKGSYGTWELTDHKHSIQIILTDSTDPSLANPYVPITPAVMVNWEILSLRKNSLKIKEIRGNDIYEFDFNNVE